MILRETSRNQTTLTSQTTRPASARMLRRSRILNSACSCTHARTSGKIFQRTIPHQIMREYGKLPLRVPWRPLQHAGPTTLQRCSPPKFQARSLSCLPDVTEHPLIHNPSPGFRENGHASTQTESDSSLRMATVFSFTHLLRWRLQALPCTNSHLCVAERSTTVSNDSNDYQNSTAPNDYRKSVLLPLL